MWYCQLTFEAALKTPLCYIKPLLAQKSNSYDWLWPYVALVIRLHRCTEWHYWLLRVFLTGYKTNDVLFFSLIFLIQRQQHFNYYSLLLITCGWVEIILCCCYIVYREGQSRVCTWVFRWWFTYILSSWVIEWLSHFPLMRKVAIYGLPLKTSYHLCGKILLWGGIISWSPPALAFNTLQLFSNYFKCMHRRF